MTDNKQKPEKTIIRVNSKATLSSVYFSLVSFCVVVLSLYFLKGDRFILESGDFVVMYVYLIDLVVLTSFLTLTFLGIGKSLDFGKKLLIAIVVGFFLFATLGEHYLYQQGGAIRTYISFESIFSNFLQPLFYASFVFIFISVLLPLLLIVMFTGDYARTAKPLNKMIKSLLLLAPFALFVFIGVYLHSSCSFNKDIGCVTRQAISEKNLQICDRLKHSRHLDICRKSFVAN